MSQNKKTDAVSVEEYRKNRKKQIEKSKRKTSGKGIKPKTKKLIGKIAGITLAVIVALGIIFVIGYNSGIRQRITTVAKFGDVKVSAAEYNYFYQTTVQNYLTQYEDVLSYMNLDTETPLDEQYYNEDENITWADFFHDQTMQSMRQIITLCGEAEKENYELTDTDKQTIENTITNLESICKNYENGPISVSYYLSQVYGKGTNKSVMKDVVTMYTLANSFETYKYNSFPTEDSDIETYYSENQNDFDIVTYRSFKTEGTIEPAEGETLTDEQNEENKAQAKTAADNMLANITDEASFNTAAQNAAPEDSKSEYDDPDATLVTEASYSTVSSTSEDIANWLFDSSRKEGDKTSIEVDNNYYVLYFISRGKYEYNTKNVRHILVRFETTTDDSGNETVTDEAKETALATAEEIYDEWKSGDATEESFAELANERSEDGAVGGLYENVYKGQMVEGFEDWCFDESRKPGDTEIVESEYGYHIMYFVGDGEQYYKVQVADAIKTNGYNDFLTAALELYPAEEITKNLKATSYGGKKDA